MSTDPLTAREQLEPKIQKIRDQLVVISGTLTLVDELIAACLAHQRPPEERMNESQRFLEQRSALGLTTDLDVVERLRSIRVNFDAWPSLLASPVQPDSKPKNSGRGAGR